MINSVKPDFFSVNIKNAIKKRKDIEQAKKQQEVELTEPMHNILMNSEHLSKSKALQSFNSLNKLPFYRFER